MRSAVLVVLWSSDHPSGVLRFLSRRAPGFHAFQVPGAGARACRGQRLFLLGAAAGGPAAE